MKVLTVLLGFVLAHSFATAAEIARTYYVAPAPRGSDNHDGSAKAPFQTLDQARRAVRSYLAQTELKGNVVVEIAAGTYELSAPLRFEPEDSGQNNFNVIYRAAPDAKVTLSGGHRITNWRKTDENTYQASVGDGVDFRQLWVNDRRAVRAREPNVGAYLKFSTEKQADGFDVPRDLLSEVDLTSDEVEFSVLIAWMHKRLRIARVADSADAKSNTVRAVIKEPEWDGVTKQPQGNRTYLSRNYWLENAREFLDAPGEFLLSKKDNTVYYRPRVGENMAEAVVVRPELESLIVLDGRLDAPVHHLRFEGLTFAHTGWTRPNHSGFVDVQANSLVPVNPAASVDTQYRHDQRKDRIPAAFQARTADNVVVLNCRFAQLGGTGIMFTGGGNDNVIEGNSFIDLAAGGIEIGEDAARPANPRVFPRRNRIANNFIAHVGQDYFGSAAILGYYTDSSLITHNEITAVPYTAVSQGWGWGNPTGPDDARGNRITKNRATNFMRRLDDGGGIYTTDRQLDSEISGNVVQRMLQPDAHTDAGGALYLDQFTEGYRVHDNIVTESIRWMFIWNPNIRGNRVERNYADAAAWRNDGKDNIVEPALPLIAGKSASATDAIFANAGLEPAFKNTRAVAAPSDVIVESTSVDFQMISGEWKSVVLPDNSYSARGHESTTPDTSARWTPILPRSGEYEVSMWRSPSEGPIAFTLERGADTIFCKALEASATAGWQSLGRYSFEAGVFTSLRVNAGKGTVVSAVRFNYVGN